MKHFILSLCLAILVCRSYAQILCVNCEGAPIPSKYGAKIEKTLHREVGFFGPLGLSDTVRVKLLVFHDRIAGETFLAQYDKQALGHRYNGMFLPEIETAVLVSSENMEYGSRTICHEISHFLYHQVFDDAPKAVTATAYSLNEGLACYFETFEVKGKDRVYQKPITNFINSVKTLIEIDEFRLDDYLKMNGREFKDLSHYNGQVSYHASYVIVATLFEHLGIEKMRELLSMIRSGITYEKAVEQLYPGGKESLMDDIKTFIYSVR